MAYFSEENVQELEAAYAEVEGKYESLMMAYCGREFSNSKAQEYAIQGFLRRVKTMKRCIDNIYSICPPDIDCKLSSEERSDLEINLQAFIFNVYGCLDNLAWVWVKERGIKNKDDKEFERIKVGFKSNEIRSSFSQKFQDYLTKLDDWYSHVEGFRHSLAHRIPLYVPPYVSNAEEMKKEYELEALKMDALTKRQFNEFERLSDQIDRLGSFVPFMMHSADENSPWAIFHAQVIADWNTVMEISQHFIEELNRKTPQGP